MMGPTSNGRSIISATLVRVRRPLIKGVADSPKEPLESELAVQVEYDMDEQGVPTCPAFREVVLTNRQTNIGWKR